MTSVWALAALWLSLALIAGLFSIWLRISTALSEIVVGTVAQLIFGAVIGSAVLGTDESWIKFLSGVGAIVLTFLAGQSSIRRCSSSNGRRRSRSALPASSFRFSGARRAPITCSDGR